MRRPSVIEKTEMAIEYSDIIDGGDDEINEDELSEKKLKKLRQKLNLKSTLALLKDVEKFIVKVDIKNKKDGEHLKSYEDLIYDDEIGQVVLLQASAYLMGKSSVKKS